MESEKHHSLTFTTRAEDQSKAAFDYYWALNEKLGQKFLGRIDEAVDLLLLNPYAFRKRYKEARIINLRQFPYQLIYRVVKDEIIVFSFFHSKSDPEKWQGLT
jgi:plasmid stabilization system protein ParE